MHASTRRPRPGGSAPHPGHGLHKNLPLKTLTCASRGPEGGVRPASVPGGRHLRPTAGARPRCRRAATCGALRSPRFLAQSQVDLGGGDARPVRRSRRGRRLRRAALGRGRSGSSGPTSTLSGRGIIVESTAIEVHRKVAPGQEPKTRRSQRTIPIVRSVMRRVEQHLADHVGPEPAWRPAVERAGLDGFAFHGLRHSLVGPLQGPGDIRMGRPQQRRLHPHPLRWAVRGRFGGGR